MRANAHTASQFNLIVFLMPVLIHLNDNEANNDGNEKNKKKKKGPAGSI